MREYIYTSRAVTPFGDDELRHLLAEARRFNAEHGLTGMLLYYRDEELGNGAFMQYLEGPDDAIEMVVRERIEPDRRHRGITTFVDRPRSGRIFENWTMAFPCDPDAPAPEGFIDLMEADLSPERGAELALRLLQQFREAAQKVDGRL